MKLWSFFNFIGQISLYYDYDMDIHMKTYVEPWQSNFIELLNVLHCHWEQKVKYDYR